MRPSLSEDSSDATITAELFFEDVYMRDDVHNFLRDAACILAEKHCSMKLFVSVFHAAVYTKNCSISGKQPSDKLSASLNLLFPTLFIFLLVSICFRAGQFAFLITFIEVILFSSKLSLYVHR